MEFDKAYFDAGLERRGTDCMKWVNSKTHFNYSTFSLERR